MIARLRPFRSVIPLVVWVSLSTAIPEARAQNQSVRTAPVADYVATAVRIEGRATVDGVLDEPFWNDIRPVTDFVQREPRDGAPATERTEVRIAYNADFLYFGITLFDSEPGRIMKSVLQREGPSQRDDHVLIGIDTYFDHRNAYIFGLNPFGTQEDAIVTDEGPPNWNWEGVYWSEARITESGWVLEVAIPFSTIRYDRVAAPTMGIAFYRQIRRKNEEAFWPPIGRNYSSQFYQVSRYARLEGLSGLKQSRHLQLKPYMLLGGEQPGKNVTGADFVRRFGADARYAITSDATLDLTYNTDFAQVEADNVQVNLTRFNLFFPEKREFFLERNGLFSFGVPNVFSGGFGGGPLEAATYFSRRIGTSQPILGGARYTGKSGPLSMGFLDIQSKSEGDLSGQNYGVARLKLDASPRRSVGAIFTNVKGGGLSNQAAGGDVALRFWRSSSLSGWLSHVWDPRYTSSTTAANANVLVRNDRASFEGDYLNVGRHFDPAVGFVRRLDMVRYRSDVGLYPRPGGTIIRQVRFNAGGFDIHGQDGARQSTEAYLKTNVNFESGDSAGVDVTRDTDRLVVPFTITNAVIPPALYDYTYARLYAGTNQARRWSFSATWLPGQFYGGTKQTYLASILYKFAPQLQVNANVQRDNLDLPVENGRFSTTLVGMNVFAAAGRLLYSNSLVQYDSISRNLQANIRIRWIHRPGSDLYLVYNTAHHYADRLDLQNVLDDRHAGVMKLTYLVAF